MKKKWNIYVIHHSHTDIGYTQRQDKITRYHYNFIQQAIDILDKIHNGQIVEVDEFRWQCENYWQVENFYAMATDQEILSFEEYVRKGKIGLSGNYLNMTELIDSISMKAAFDKMKEYRKKNGFSITSGMSADINGFSWGYCDLLAEYGVENFFSCLHPHHGMFPLYKKQMPFFWEGPKGGKVLVWNGEHYHLGNELFLAPYAGNSYMILDEFATLHHNGLFFKRDRRDTLQKEREILETRVRRYLENLEREGYQWDFIPIMVSGGLTDNGFPSEGVAQRMKELNTHFSGELKFHMATLDEFFKEVRNQCEDIPTYQGDWTDWWADGVGSTPEATKICRDAQRKIKLCHALDPKQKLANPQLLEDAKKNIVMYAEHTWGYSSSVSEPWNTFVSSLDLKKTAYATNANTQVHLYLDEMLSKKGESCIRYQRPQHFKVINPNKMAMEHKVVMVVEGWEYIEGTTFGLHSLFEVVDFKSGEIFPHQIVTTSRGYEVEVVLKMDALEERELYFQTTEHTNPYTIKNHPHIGADGVVDVVQPDKYEVSSRKIETDYFVITFDQVEGIVGIIDKQDGVDLVKETAEVAPFNGVYEVTVPEDGDQINVRREMGRNRKSPATQRDVGTIKDIRIVADGDVYVTVQLQYELEGTEMYRVLLKVYKNIPHIDTVVQIHKASTWSPENLYISLPFGVDQGETFLDKTGCVLRPGIDQLPGSCKEFYLLQNGIVHTSEKKQLAVAIKDAPLVVFGDLKSHPIELCDGRDTLLNQKPVYSWVMNNFWETNFKVNLGGFHEFAYSLRLLPKEPVEKSFEKCNHLYDGFVSLYI